MALVANLTALPPPPSGGSTATYTDLQDMAKRLRSHSTNTATPQVMKLFSELNKLIQQYPWVLMTNEVQQFCDKNKAARKLDFTHMSVARLLLTKPVEERLTRLRTFVAHHSTFPSKRVPEINEEWALARIFQLDVEPVSRLKVGQQVCLLAEQLYQLHRKIAKLIKNKLESSTLLEAQSRSSSSRGAAETAEVAMQLLLFSRAAEEKEEKKQMVV